MGYTQADATPLTFSAALESIQSNQNHTQLILFLADNETSTGQSWCPDCRRAEPVIYEILEKTAKDVVLLRAYAGDRPTWRNPSHPWRIDERFNLKGLPTLIRWENDSVAGRLEDYEAHISSRINQLLED